MITGIIGEDANRATSLEIESYLSQLSQMNSRPEFVSESAFLTEENQLSIGTVIATDEDGDNVTYSVSGTELTINTFNGALARCSSRL